MPEGHDAASDYNAACGAGVTSQVGRVYLIGWIGGGGPGSREITGALDEGIQVASRVVDEQGACSVSVTELAHGQPVCRYRAGDVDVS